jgi:hypothetical protein
MHKITIPQTIWWSFPTPRRYWRFGRKVTGGDAHCMTYSLGPLIVEFCKAR